MAARKPEAEPIGRTPSRDAASPPPLGDPNFDASNITNPAWGTLTFTFFTCNTGLVEFNSTLGFGTGSMALSRLTLPLGETCP